MYQYFYQGHRTDAATTEFVFEVSADRVSSFPVSIFLTKAAVTAWEKTHGRDLNGTEQYAIAKMALFAAFDDRSAPPEMRQPVHVGTDQVESIIEGLGLESID